MAKKPRVGIFMPAYNQGLFIHEAIESLEKQTFQDFEVIIADDHSDDGLTPQILKSLKYNKARMFFNETNVGISKQTRRFSQLLGNEYFFILCADDKIHPEYIESCVNYLDKNQKDAAVASWIQCFDKHQDIIKISRSKAKLPEMLYENNYLGSSMTRRIALEDIGYSETRKPFKKHYDYDRWVSMLEKGWSLGVINRPLFYYRKHNTSLSKSISIPEEMAFQRAFVNKHKRLFEKHGSEIALHYKEKVLKELNWIKELQEGRDWLEKEYRRLLRYETPTKKLWFKIKDKKFKRPKNINS